MSTTPASSPDPAAPGHVDVLIVGAGLSGIGAACHLQAEAPGTIYAHRRGARAPAAGPGTCSGSPASGRTRTCSPSVTRSGHGSRPRRSPAARRSCATSGRRRPPTASTSRSRYHSRVVRADWSSPDARWTVTVEHTGTGRRGPAYLRLPVPVLGLLPLRPGLHAGLARARTDFAGTIVHPQHWPADLDLTGKRVVVIGSGATAVTHRAGARRDGRARDHAAALAVVRAVAARPATRSPTCSARCCPSAGPTRRCGGRTPGWRPRSTTSAASTRPGRGRCCARAPSSACRPATTWTPTSPRPTSPGTSACAWCPTATSSPRSGPGGPTS